MPLLRSLSKLALDRLLGLFSQPKLKLVHHFRHGYQGDESAGTMGVAIQNSGKKIAKNVIVELRIYKPQGISSENGLLFNLDSGDFEVLADSTIWDVSTRLKPKCFRYRLKPHVFVDARRPPLEIVDIVICVQKEIAPESLDHEIEWTVYCARVPPTAGQLAWSGFELKQMLVGNHYESGHEVGEEVHSNELPELPQDSSK